jgi:hypothetical protein
MLEPSLEVVNLDYRTELFTMKLQPRKEVSKTCFVVGPCALAAENVLGSPLVEAREGFQLKALRLAVMDPVPSKWM